jgi:hypothetical protein
VNALIPQRKSTLNLLEINRSCSSDGSAGLCML